MINMQKIIRIIDELIFEAQKEPTWKAENALRCVKKELLKEQEAKKVIESTNVVRCDDCEYSFCEGFVRERLYCEKHPELGEIKGDWFCADCWKA